MCPCKMWERGAHSPQSSPHTPVRSVVMVGTVSQTGRQGGRQGKYYSHTTDTTDSWNSVSPVTSSEVSQPPAHMEFTHQLNIQHIYLFHSICDNMSLVRRRCGSDSDFLFFVPILLFHA